MAFKSKKQKKLEREQKRQEDKQKNLEGMYWFIVAIFTLLGIAALPSIGALIFFVGAIAALPTKLIMSLWKRIPIKAKWFKPTMLALVFFLAIGTFQKSVLEDNNKDTPAVVVEDAKALDKGANYKAVEKTITELENAKEPGIVEESEKVEV